jgi:hypothetical protein
MCPPSKLKSTKLSPLKLKMFFVSITDLIDPYSACCLTGVCLITYIDFSSKPDLAMSSYPAVWLVGVCVRDVLFIAPSELAAALF